MRRKIKHACFLWKTTASIHTSLEFYSFFFFYFLGKRKEGILLNRGLFLSIISLAEERGIIPPGGDAAHKSQAFLKSVLRQ